MHESHRKAEVAVIKTIERCLELGYTVSKPVFEETRYDLVLDKHNGSKLERVQVKYISTKECGTDAYIVYLQKRQTKIHKVYTEKDVDSLIVYIGPENLLLYFPLEVFSGKTTLTIRIVEPKTKVRPDKLNFAKDFIF